MLRRAFIGLIHVEDMARIRPQPVFRGSQESVGYEHSIGASVYIGFHRVEKEAYRGSTA